MSNPLFNAMQKPNPMQMIMQIKNNPMAFLQRAGMRVPSNITDPNAIIQHLLNSGQISQQKYDQARQMAQRFMSR